jgi:hypothetical protein
MVLGRLYCRLTYFYAYYDDLWSIHTLSDRVMVGGERISALELAIIVFRHLKTTFWGFIDADAHLESYNNYLEAAIQSYGLVEVNYPAEARLWME